MGLSFLVFPSTEHTRFQHALGAMHLAIKAVYALRNQGVEINGEEAEALYACMLLHDLGHGPFSHALERVLLSDSAHEEMSIALMQDLNAQFDGKLSLAIEMFSNTYPRAFFNQLISSHIDLDRLDYLKRDSFYSGVTEGNINSERLISMMMVQNDELVFNAKAVYSIEKFLLARRMMYWSVYLHKTSFVAEELLIRFFTRARELASMGKPPKSSDALAYLIQKPQGDIAAKKKYFTALDDADVWMMLKEASTNTDVVLSSLSKMLLARRLCRIELSNKPFEAKETQKRQKNLIDTLGMNTDEASYFVFDGSFRIQGYGQKEKPIKLCDQNGNCWLFDTSPETAYMDTLTKKDRKHFLVYPKDEGYFS